PEGLRDRDTRQRLLHVGVDIGKNAARLLCDAPGDAPERQRDGDDHRGDRQGDERQPGVYIEQYAYQDDELQRLTDEVEREGDDVREVLRVRRDAAHDATGRVLVVEGHVALHDSGERVV